MANATCFDPETLEWNATLEGDYLWSSVNFGEAVTEAMTPLAWTIIQFTLSDWTFVPGVPTVGNIAGRPYLNISAFATVLSTLGRGRADLLRTMEATLYMKLPEEMEIPLIPLSGSARLASLANGLRELARSQYVRDRWMIRLFALRTGELTGLGDDVFFLTLDELLGLLIADETPIAAISARKAAYLRHKMLPSCPPVIRGPFDPFQWAADENRRSDIFDGRATSGSDVSGHSRASVITGSPGSAGRVQGTVRCLASPDEMHQLRQGEVLVAVQTDIAWTVVFPRAAAVVTDMGAPLSHAAIVARELGIPAVVGCGDATARLKTGDRVLVNGGAGMVTVMRET
jgi:phosphohistidine swiveling domain-containing protein